MIFKDKIIPVKKWPEDWDKHIVQSCQLYFYNKQINFLDYNLIYHFYARPGRGVDEHIQGVKLELEYNGKYYFVEFDYKNPCFSINCFYKDYDVEKYLTPFPSINSSIMGHFSGYDDFGIYIIKLIAGQSSFEETSYEIIKTVENIILNHNDDDNNDDNNDNNDEPISPKSPVEGLKITT